MPHSFQVALQNLLKEERDKHPCLLSNLDHIIDLLKTAITPRQDHLPLSNPLDIHLSQYFDNNIGPEIVKDALKSLQGRHFWTNYIKTNSRFDGFSEHFTRSEIIGPKGMFKHENVNIGITIQAPDFFYAPHVHDCTELYFILSGTAYWKVSDDPWLPRKQGEWIQHKENEIHAMRTGDDPLITLYAYYGNSNSSIEFCNEDFHGLPQ